MSHDAYFEIEAWNWSLLKEAEKSPLHVQHRRTTPRPDTPPMRFGRACHTAVLEPDRFPLEWTVYEGRRAGKVWDEFAEVNHAKGILTVDEYDTCLAVRDAVHANPLAARLLRGCAFEQTVLWTDPDTGLACKCRPDALKPYKVIDLKTTRSIDARRFGRLAYDMGYFGQGAFYTEGVKLSVARRRRDWEFIVIAVEAEQPHDVGIFKVDDDSLYAASQDVHTLLRRVAACEKSGIWPGRYAKAEILSLPPWEFVDDGTMALEGLVPKGER